LYYGLHETKNISHVIPFSSIVLPVIPLLHNARKIHETLVWITEFLREEKELNKFIIPFEIRILIDFLLIEKCTKARVENYFT